MNIRCQNKKISPLSRFKKLGEVPIINKLIVKPFLRFDKRLDGAISFFLKNYGKSRFMISMSKKAQILGVEKLWNKGPKAFIYFFLFYLVRDVFLYILIPIFIAGL